MHISHWELGNWNTCPFYHKLVHIDKINTWNDNEYFAFGRAIHDTCEKYFTDLQIRRSNGGRGIGWLMQDKTPEYFDIQFLQEIKKLTNSKTLNKELVSSMRQQGKKIISMVPEATSDYFGNFKVISVEEKIMEPINEYKLDNIDFKGRLDFVLQTEDKKYHIIDWKTCSWGWNARKKSDKMTTYQLTYYKHYFAQKHNIDPKNIETYFALIKRTAKQNNIEFVRTPCGVKKTDNAIEFMMNALQNIKKKNYIKNRLSCERCVFRKTEHCP